MKRLLALFAICAAVVWAADVTGTWKATAEGPMGAMERTFVFQQDGEKLTGETTSSFAGKSVIEKGKISGDDLSFTITVTVEGNEATVNYTGKVKGDEMELKAETPMGAFEYKAKKQK
jgi:hypothetical protein